MMKKVYSVEHQKTEHTKNAHTYTHTHTERKRHKHTYVSPKASISLKFSQIQRMIIEDVRQ